MEKYLEKIRFIYDLPGIMILLGDDKGFEIYKAGYRDVENSILCEGNEVFHGASVAKLFTQGAIMNLKKKGDIDLDKTAFDYIEWLELDNFSKDALKIRNLLAHKTGIPFINCTWEREDFSDSALEKYLKSSEIKFLEPLKNGTNKFNYSDLNYEILGQVIEEVTGTTFEEHMQKHLLEKLDMRESSFIKPDNVAFVPHEKNREKKFERIEKWPYSREHAPSSTLYTTLTDLNKAAEAALEDTNKKAAEAAFKDTQSLFAINEYWHIYNFKNIANPIYGHHGGDTGFSSSFCVEPESKMRIIAAANCQGAPMQTIMEHIISHRGKILG